MSCQVANVTLVEPAGQYVYSPMETQIIEPFLVFVEFALQPSGKFPEMVDEFSVEVLYEPFNFSFVLGIGWMGKVWFDAVLSTPTLPLLLELWAMIRQYRLWQRSLLF